MAGFVMVEAETENATMLAFLDHGRIVNENRPIQAAKIGGSVAIRVSDNPGHA